MAAVRLVLAAGIVLVVGTISAELVFEAGAQLAAVVEQEDCESDALGNEGQCDSSLSLRQLRGELRAAVISEAMEVADAQPGHEKVDEDCAAASEYCDDIETYRLKEDCAADNLCRVIDMADSFPKLTRGEAWLCAPEDKKCDRAFSLEEFQPVEEVPQEYEGLTGMRAAAALPGTCSANRCGIYDPAAPCQCNKHCKTFGNCCGNHKDMCESGSIGHIGTCAGRSCFNYIKEASCQCNELCSQYGNCCTDYQQVCGANHKPSGSGNWSSPGIGAGGQTMTLYHTTSLEVANIIIHTGFRPGRSGWCGGAIYFINYPHLPPSKYAPGITTNGAILEAKVEMGRMATNFNKKCEGYGGTGVSAAKLSGFNSMKFNPGDGDEFIIWNPKQVLSVRIYQEKLER